MAQRREPDHVAGLEANIPIFKDKSRKLRAMQRSPNLDPKNHPWRQKYTWLFIDPLFTFALTIAQAEKPAQERVGRKTIL